MFLLILKSYLKNDIYIDYFVTIGRVDFS